MDQLDEEAAGEDVAANGAELIEEDGVDEGFAAQLEGEAVVHSPRDSHSTCTRLWQDQHHNTT